MDKRKIDAYVGEAVSVLKYTGIAENDTIEKSFRGQIATFGATVMMGSILSAVACYCEQGQANVDRSKLMAAIYILLIENKDNIKYDESKIMTANECKYKANKLFYYVREKYVDQPTEVKNDILECAIALKIAMSLFHLKKSK